MLRSPTRFLRVYRNTSLVCAFILAWLMLLLCQSQSTEAQNAAEDVPSEAPVPVTVPAMPPPGQRDQLLVVGNTNWASFQDVLLAPCAEWLRSNKIAMRVVRRLDFAWSLPADVQQKTERLVGLIDLDENFFPKFVSDPVAIEGYPFGFSADINREKDATRQAYKILWNMAYSESFVRDSLYQLEMSWIGSHSLLRRAAGVFYRSFPQRTVPPESKDEEKRDAPLDVTTKLASPELFRQDVLQFFSPPVVNSFAEFSWRYFGNVEDRTWIYSPVLGRLREILPANRSDGIIGGTLSFDDLFVFSAKPQSFIAKVVGEKTLLVPFSGVNYYRLEMKSAPEIPSAKTPTPDVSVNPVGGALRKASGGDRKGDVLTAPGYYQRPDGSGTMVTWNHESRQLAQLAPWVPTSVTFVPRRVWILELVPRDPSYAHGREVLVVDQESMLPVYKLAYDRAGDYRKTVLGGWGYARSKDGSVRFPFIGFVLSVDQSAQVVTAVTTQHVQTFLGKAHKSALAYRKLLLAEGHPEKNPKKKSDEKDSPVAAETLQAKEEVDSEAPAGGEAQSGSASEPDSLPPAAPPTTPPVTLED